MKKIFAMSLLTLIVSAGSCYALTSDDFTSPTYMKNYNYSDEMYRIVEIQKNRANGVAPTYKYNEPSWYESDKKARYIRNLLMYLDCGLDDHKFINNDGINFTSRWDNI